MSSFQEVVNGLEFSRSLVGTLKSAGTKFFDKTDLHNLEQVYGLLVSTEASVKARSKVKNMKFDKNTKVIRKVVPIAVYEDNTPRQKELQESVRQALMEEFCTILDENKIYEFGIDVREVETQSGHEYVGTLMYNTTDKSP